MFRPLSMIALERRIADPSPWKIDPSARADNDPRTTSVVSGAGASALVI
jgi:hypothetical protein